MTSMNLRLGWGVIALAVIAVPAGARAVEPKQPVLMISIDGMRPDYVTKAAEHGLKLPNLQRFLSEGAYAEGVVGVVPTLTYPSHTTLVTGVTPAVHGIYSNTTSTHCSRTKWAGSGMPTWNTPRRCGLRRTGEAS